MTLNILALFSPKYFRKVTKVSARNSASLSAGSRDIFHTSSLEHGERKRKAFTSASLLGSEMQGKEKNSSRERLELKKSDWL